MISNRLFVFIYCGWYLLNFRNLVVRFIKSHGIDSLNKEYSNNERILQMNASGVSVKEIAKKLNMGVGEVRLVINLYKGGKQQ